MSFAGECPSPAIRIYARCGTPDFNSDGFPGPERLVTYLRTLRKQDATVGEDS